LADKKPRERAKRLWTWGRGKGLAEDLDLLMAVLCTEWGFCNRLTGAEVVRDFPVLTGDGFARAVLKAEGMYPDAHEGWRIQIEKQFTLRYGGQITVDQYAEG